MNDQASASTGWQESGGGMRGLVGEQLTAVIGRLRGGARNRRRRVPPPHTLSVWAERGDGEAALLLRVFNRFPQPLLVSDAEGQIVGVNPAARALLGGGAPLLGVPLAELLPSLAPGLTIDPGAARQETVTTPAGTRLDLEVRVLPYAHAGHRGLVLILHDITPYLELNRQREQLLHNVAHELSTPLCTLENALELAREEAAAGTAQAELLERATRTAARLRALMGDLLTAGAIQSGQLTVAPMLVSVADLLDEAIESIEPALKERRQRLDVQIAPDADAVHADASPIVRVLTNLLSNASKYGPPETTIAVRVQEEGDAIRFDIIDQGPGIPPEEQLRLFSRYYRSRPGGQTPGIGLGLAIARGVVAAHGGLIGVDSTEGSGARLWFTLPTVASPGDPPT